MRRFKFDMTVDKFLEMHRNLWDWLSANPEKGKAMWPGWHDYSNHPVEHNCIACSFGYFVSGDSSKNAFDRCNNCLLDWGGDENKCCTFIVDGSGYKSVYNNCEGLFEKWNAARNRFAYVICTPSCSVGYIKEARDEVVKYATLIRDLPLSAVAIKLKAEGWEAEGKENEKENN